LDAPRASSTLATKSEGVPVAAALTVDADDVGHRGVRRFADITLVVELGPQRVPDVLAARQALEERARIEGLAVPTAKQLPSIVMEVEHGRRFLPASSGSSA
jgi:hypothetical protein